MVLGLGSWELVFVGLALLILFGPEHAPEAIRKLGRMQARVERALQQLDEAVEYEESGSDEDSWGSGRDELPASEDEDDEA